MSQSEENEVLHASLLRGTLSVHVTDVDIRRTDDEGGFGHYLLGSSIETDYILQIQSTNKVPDLETYSCSKRYLEVRNLAYSLHSIAVEIVKYYESSKANENSSGSFVGASGKSLLKGVGKVLVF